MALRDASFVVLDFETTGLSPRRDEVIEAGAVHFDGAVGGASYHALACPGRPIPERATEVHGITNEAVELAPPFTDSVPDLVRFLGERVVVAHHARFDGTFLRFAAGRAGLPPILNPLLCTVRLSRRLFPELASHNLEALCRHHGIPRRARHRALEDAEATAWLLDVLLERAEEEGVATLDELLALGAPPGVSTPRAPRPLTEQEQLQLEDAILTGDRIELQYVSRRGVRSCKFVVPYGVQQAGGSASLVAYDVGAGTTRTFRLDRVARIGREPEKEEVH